MTENCNVDNRTIFCDDNLDVMRGINSECIDLIYLDPPFNKNKKFTAPIGSSAEGASFKDIFRKEDVKDEWLQTIEEDIPDLYHYLSGIKGVGKDYNFAYLAYMAIRLIECHRVLKSTGSIYLHCDPTMSHYLKTTMDCIFGEDNFRNEIVWCYTDPAGRKNSKFYKRTHDFIYWYTKDFRSCFINQIAKSPLSDSTIGRYGKYFDGNGQITYERLKSKSPGAFEALKSVPEDLSEVWLDKKKGTNKADWWDDIRPLKRKGGKQSGEALGYPTQKPIALLTRIIETSSTPTDIVLDPFCGCATTCVASEKLNRKWIGIDISVKAYELVKERLEKEAADPGDLFKYQNKVYMKTDPPRRTDQGFEHRETKWVYVISHPNFRGEYKVGIAKNWKSRLNSYQTSDPDRKYEMEFRMETPWFRETERHIHDIFDNKHEWVQGDLKEIIQAIKDYYPPE